MSDLKERREVGGLEGVDASSTRKKEENEPREPCSFDPGVMVGDFRNRLKKTRNVSSRRTRQTARPKEDASSLKRAREKRTDVLVP